MPRAKKNLDIKLAQIPPVEEIVAENIRNISSVHLVKFISVFGTVVRTSAVNNRELYKEFKCRDCGKLFKCNSEISEFNRFNLPSRCDGRVEKKKNPFFDIVKTMM